MLAERGFGPIINLRDGIRAARENDVSLVPYPAGQ
jgi:hypothetical protein